MKKKLAVKQEFKQESEFNICAKTGAGAGSGVNVFGAGVDSESKILDSDHLCCAPPKFFLALMFLL